MRSPFKRVYKVSSYGLESLDEIRIDMKELCEDEYTANLSEATVVVRSKLRKVLSRVFRFLGLWLGREKFR